MWRQLYSEIDSDSWLSQANYIFSQLPTPPKDCCKYSHCQSVPDAPQPHATVLVDRIIYHLRFSETPEDLREGYLLLCPLDDLRDDNGRWFPKPGCPAYWSLHPSGTPRLSSEEASSLGFPSLDIEMEVRMRAWNDSVYAALSRFQAGKGFDPNSQDVARHRGHPLFELSSNPYVDHAHSEYRCYIYFIPDSDLTTMNSRRGIFGRQQGCGSDSA